jgi:tetratricopeptide (TPR) repeat protein
MWSHKLFIALFLLAGSAVYAAPDDDAYSSLKKSSGAAAQKSARSFLKKYPASGHVPDARMILADNETDPDRAYSLYIGLANNYRYYAKRDDAHLNACEILFFLSRFSECAEESLRGYDIYTTSAIRNKFLLLAADSYHAMQQYEKAADLLSKSGFQSSPVLRADALSRSAESGTAEWLSILSSSYPEAALYRLGREYELDGFRDKAFSAYADLIKKYPRSAESLVAVKQKDRLAKEGAKYTSGYADRTKKILRLSPDRPASDSRAQDEFSILVGPFYNLRQAGTVKKEMTAEFSHAVIVKRDKEFVIYIGRVSDQDEAVSMKIRLAEEFGFNGTIVNIREEENSEYFYGQ